MKTAVRNGLILSSYLLGVSALRHTLTRRNERPVTRIAAFHKVKDEAAFEEKIRYLSRAYHTVGLQDFLDGRLAGGRINVVVTFDDGYQSWLRALPVLRRYRVPVVFFVSSGYLDATEQGQWARYCEEHLGVSPEPSIRWDDLRAMARQERVEIGGHTVHHTSLGPQADLGVAAREINDDKRRIEQATGMRLSFFAYPFGHAGTFCRDTAALVAAAGYQAGVTLVPGANIRRTDRFSLHRDGIDDLRSRLLLKAWLSGAYDPLRSALTTLTTRERPTRR
jgi:peptidoglycan/xylan/chitin deacetylase (PgdA/CDA1 family)